MTLATLALLLLIAAIGAKYFLRRETIYSFERGLLYDNGTFTKILGAGSYWYCPYLQKIQKVDTRLKLLTAAGQEVLTSDSVSVKVSVGAFYEITDLNLAVNTVQNVEDALYVEAQLVLREVTSSYKVDELLEKRSEVAEKLFALLLERGAKLGVTVKTASIKDITFPGELKRIFAEVVRAQKAGLAALERARGESASLRHLANAAKLLESNPGLMQLRMLQTIGEGTGNTVVLGMGNEAQVVPVKGARSKAPSQPVRPSIEEA